MLTNKEAIHCPTEKLANEVLKILHENGHTWCDGDNLLHHNYYDRYGKDICYTNKVDYSSKTWYLNSGYSIINAQDFIERHSHLPAEFVVCVTSEEEFHEVQDYCMKITNSKEWEASLHRNSFNDYNQDSKYYVEVSKDNPRYDHTPIWGTLPIITFEEFKNKIMKKEIIGYKFTKPEYKEAVEKILKVEKLRFCGEYHFMVNSDYHKILKEAGVIDIWFEAVYKKEDKFHTINHGNGDSFQVKIVKDGFELEGFFVGRDNILHIVNKCNPSAGLPWNCRYDSVTIGCKKNIPISELEKLIK